MITIRNTQNFSVFYEKYISLINDVIDLPSETKTYFKNQWSSDKFINLKDNWIFLEAVDLNNEINGILIATPTEGGVGTIVWILVDEKFQNRKIGTLLFDESIKKYLIKGAHKIKLTVPNENTVKFYNKMGMVLEAIHKNHWWNHDFWAMGIVIK